jgi:predicted transcriptional regulator
VITGMKGERKISNKPREEIAVYIEEHPGISFNILQDVFRMNPGTLRYHLEYLESSNRIDKRIIKHERCYFPEGTNLKAYFPSLDTKGLKKEHKRVYYLIKQNGGISRKEIMKSLNITRKEMNYAVSRLKDKKLIWLKKDGSDPVYECITEDRLKKEIFRILLKKLAEGEIDERTFLRIKEKLED